MRHAYNEKLEKRINGRNKIVKERTLGCLTGRKTSTREYWKGTTSNKRRKRRKKNNKSTSDEGGNSPKPNSNLEDCVDATMQELEDYIKKSKKKKKKKKIDCCSQLLLWQHKHR